MASTIKVFLRSPGALLALLLAWTNGAQAQNMAAFVLEAQRCRASGGSQVCRAALEQSHKLRNWAEARRLWRCYTALLGAEAEMIAASRTPGQGDDPAPLLRDMRQACGR